MTQTSLTNNRLDYLDAVRAFALILGIVFHASLSFSPMYIGWAVMDVSTSSIVSKFMMISHSFRMELFFLMAGFFSHMTFHRKGAGQFLKSRWVRIAVPFLVAWFILRPLVVSGWIMGGQSLRGDVDILSGLKGGFESLSSLPSGIFTGTHLWFLYYLLIITTIILILRLLINAIAPAKHGFIQFFDTAIKKLCHSPFAILLLAIPTAGILWFMNNWGVDTPDQTLAPMWPVLTLYGGFFAFGWLLHRQAELTEQFAKLTWGKTVVLLVAAALTNWLASFAMKTGISNYLLIKAAFCVSYSLMMWCLVALTIGLFKRWFNQPSKAVRYIADASYWMYLIHLPVVVWLQIAFAELALHWTIKLFAVSSITILLSLLTYDLLVRNSFVGLVLNGRRKSAFLTPRLFAVKPSRQSA